MQASPKPAKSGGKRRLSDGGKIAAVAPSEPPPALPPPKKGRGASSGGVGVREPTEAEARALAIDDEQIWLMYVNSAFREKYVQDWLRGSDDKVQRHFLVQVRRQ